jgi:ATP-dependent helicase IRC3
LTIEKAVGEDYYAVTERRRVPQKYWRRPSQPIYAKPRIIATTERFEDALHAADTYAKGIFEQIFIATNQNWRRRPATEAQVAFLNRFRDKNDPLSPDAVTKGKAADMITKIKNGARGRFGEIVTQKRRVARESLKIEQLEALRRREEVTVGPLMD